MCIHVYVCVCYVYVLCYTKNSDWYKPINIRAVISVCYDYKMKTNCIDLFFNKLFQADKNPLSHAFFPASVRFVLILFLMTLYPSIFSPLCPVSFRLLNKIESRFSRFQQTYSVFELIRQFDSRVQYKWYQSEASKLWLLLLWISLFINEVSMDWKLCFILPSRKYIHFFSSERELARFAYMWNVMDLIDCWEHELNCTGFYTIFSSPIPLSFSHTHILFSSFCSDLYERNSTILQFIFIWNLISPHNRWTVYWSENTKLIKAQFEPNSIRNANNLIDSMIIIIENTNTKLE